MENSILNNDYSVPAEVRERMAQHVREFSRDCEIAIATRFSNLRGDGYLYWVVVRRPEQDNYVLWMYNDSLGGLYDGNYDLNFKEACELLAKKVRFITL